MAIATQTIYRKSQAKPCHHCEGRRVVTRMEPKWWGGSKSGVALRNHLVPKCYECDVCHGTGKAAA